MSEQLANDVSTTLNGAIADNDTSLVVTSATGFPTTGDFRIRIDDEIMTVTAVSGTTFTVSRASEAVGGSQTAASHSNGATVTHVLTAGALRNFGLPAGFIGAKVYHSVDQTVGFLAALAMDSKDYDSDGFWNSGTNTRLTIPAGLSGKYRIIYMAETKVSTADSNLQVRVDGTTFIRGSRLYLEQVKGTIGTVEAELNGGQYIEFIVGNIAGSGNTSVYGAATATELGFTVSIVKLDSGRVGSGIGARVFRTSSTNINHDTWTAIPFDNESFDTDLFHSNSTDPSRITIPAGLAGKYLAIGLVAWEANTTGHRYSAFAKNGSRIINIPIGLASLFDTHGAGFVISDLIDLNSGDFVELHAYQDSGGTLTVRSGTYFILIRIDSAAANVTDALIYDLDADVTSVSTTYLDAASGTPDAGTYDIFWKLTGVGGGHRSLYARLLAGSTEIDYTEGEINTNGYRLTLTGFALGITLDGSTVVKSQAKFDTSGNTISRNGGSGTNNDATKIELRRVK